MDRQITQGKWVESFKAGTHTDFSGVKRTFSPEDISAIADGVKRQVAAGYEPPLVKGHPKTDSPRKASIIDAKVGDKNVLMLQVDKIEPRFSEEVKNGEYPYVSVALYGDYSKGIKHLGALGGVAPAVKGLKQMEFAEGEGEIFYFACPFGSSTQGAFRTIGNIFRKLREKLIEAKSVEEADGVYSEWDLKTLEDFQAPTEENLGEAPAFAEGETQASSESDETKKENEALKAKVETLEAEKAKAQEEKEKAEAEARKNMFAEKLDVLTKQGKLRASQRPHVEKVFELVGDGSLSFAEGGSVEESLLKIIESSEPFIKSGEWNFAEGNSEPPNAKMAAAKIEELVKKEGLTTRQAYEKLNQGRT